MDNSHLQPADTNEPAPLIAYADIPNMGKSAKMNRGCAVDNQSLMPQTEEDIEELAWLPKSAWGTVVENTFPSIRILLRQLGDG